MLQYEETIVIRGSVAEVFQYMQDLEREHEWQPNLRQASQEPDGVPGVGTTRNYVSEFLGKQFRNTYIYTVYEPNQRVVYESTSESDTQATSEILWKAVEGGTQVTLRVAAETSGLLRFVPRSLVTSVGKRELGESLTRLKGLLESKR
jgi:uncharacterized protein YndB with AHSA1/START domain